MRRNRVRAVRLDRQPTPHLLLSLYASAHCALFPHLGRVGAHYWEIRAMARCEVSARRWAQCLPANLRASVRYRTDDERSAPYAAWRPLDGKQLMKSAWFTHSMRYSFRRSRTRRQCAFLHCPAIETEVRRDIAALRRDTAGRVDIGVLASSLSAGRSHDGERRLAAFPSTRSFASRPDPIYRSVPRTLL